MREVTEALLEILSTGRRGALATVVRASGSTPQQAGARLLLRPDGSIVGTVGGGAIEHTVIAELRACVRDGRPRYVGKDLMRDLGMCCGGRMEVFVEPIEGRARLVIFGAGHVAKPTAALARTIGFSVWIVDDREELNTSDRFPECERVIAEPAEAIERVAPTDRDWLLVMTHDHRLDEEALDAYARQPHAYLGVIGSKRKIYRILQRISAKHGLPSLDRVYAPVGLELGAVTPEEIAISIAAELVALRHGHRADHMRAIDDPVLAQVLGGQLSVESAAQIDRE